MNKTSLKNVKSEDIYNKEEQKLLSNCTLCPRECKVNRFEGGGGYCGADAGMNIASICIHRGEEPPISGVFGICNIFFSGCNMRCQFCQNHEISRIDPGYSGYNLSLDNAIDQISNILSAGIRAVGFVSPSHVVPQVKAIIRGLNDRGLQPITVYNTNSYDKPVTITSMADLIDVYLPDYKYVTPDTSGDLSDASDYPEVAFRAIKEMYFQKGSTLIMDKTGSAERGILLRHLVLPVYVEESRRVLRKIAEELSTGINISLMSQYHPTPSVRDHPELSRSLYRKEYETVVKTMEELGFRNGWVQDMGSYRTYRPDFAKQNPFV